MTTAQALQYIQVQVGEQVTGDDRYMKLLEAASIVAQALDTVTTVACMTDSAPAIRKILNIVE